MLAGAVVVVVVVLLGGVGEMPFRHQGQQAKGIGAVTAPVVIRSQADVAVFIALFVSCVLGGIAGLVTLAVRRNRRHFIAFGPWLVTGALVTVVFEQTLRRLLLG